MIRKKVVKALRVPPGRKFRLADRDPGMVMIPELDDRDTAEDAAKQFLRENLDELSDARRVLSRILIAWLAVLALVVVAASLR